ncbi:heme A synthase [Flavipsychrobacter stenotrophus]|uniref:Heme A synthase n=1 Tax=Flavipsychrobacter stenotrophus TaxID=2077091 RepID=A0A2S7SZ74_9BACT|nr:COX15/CtaA family protein [Flavipsychrobacter stenotrophus]PQJ11875.1 heme A synthase [Flavipsychrobacter stenotrophus]
MEQKKKNAVAWWLVAGVIMIIIQTLLGGVTRLTGSGLSITEWKPIMGALPPMNEQEWNKAFDGYKQIGQYKFLNSDFTLHDFKLIFFWEWFHRLWARLLGVVFLIGFAYFLVKQYFSKEMIKPFIILFLLGAMQGLIGWIMVASGLNDENLYVNHIKLSAHFVSAMVLACYTLWFALQLLIPDEKRVVNKNLQNFTIAVILILFVQLTYGAFMAGLKAAMAAATWPTINGMWLPDTLTHNSWINDKINVHFIHRGLAYILLTVIIMWFARTRPTSRFNHLLRRTRLWPMALVTLQVVLGIITVISAPHIVMGKFGLFESLAELHQLVAMFLLMALVVNLYVVKRR